ncbi:MAG TPA: DUF4142 domain-containing protein [Mucilaginibacter sp.]|nr:DUF4142 domain-containing protein [Mucilaginibacter sp.]
MKTNICPAIIAVIFLLFAQSCTNNSNASIDSSGASFINMVLGGGNAGIKASELARSHSQNPRVKNLATMMIADQSKINSRLDSIIKNNGALKVDSTISAPNHQLLNDLTKKTGTDFDKSYVQMTVKQQEKNLMLFINATQDKNSDLQNLARQSLKIIHLQLDSARAIELSLK